MVTNPSARWYRDHQSRWHWENHDYHLEFNTPRANNKTKWQRISVDHYANIYPGRIIMGLYRTLPYTLQTKQEPLVAISTYARLETTSNLFRSRDDVYGTSEVDSYTYQRIYFTVTVCGHVVHLRGEPVLFESFREALPVFAYHANKCMDNQLSTTMQRLLSALHVT